MSGLDPALEAKLGEMGIPPAMAQQFVSGFWDSPMVSQVAFMARKMEKADNPKGFVDGEIEVEEGISIGYRLFNDVKLEEGVQPTVNARPVWVSV